MFRTILVAAAVVVATVASAGAAPLAWRIAGTGAGTLDGADWSGRFAFTIHGDSANHVDEFGVNVVSPLDSVALRIAGVGTAVLQPVTSLGYNDHEGVVFLGRVGDTDLFNFDVDAPIDLARHFAPVIGRHVYALNQFLDVPTSLGALTFDTSSDVAFSAVPLPAAAPLLVVALAGAGLLAGVRRRAA
ncbi:hypothetical protein [Amaricoccus sp.]|uniref:hypothetical protein n=1 Tax=Amaricoccus sp. TaxID=1872485 RepID=UPI001B50EFDB|nr:hypothetical protein [Amaricoccus sp.]MBP7002964.1 hypothetical protein [Amaricoccus sp.]